MNEARSLVSAFVNTLLNSRERNEMEWTRGDWRPNAAAANCYKGAQEVNFQRLLYQAEVDH